MKNLKVFNIIMWFGFLIILIVFSLNIINNYYEDREKTKNIIFVAKTMSNDYWKAIKRGADSAKKEFGTNLKIYAPDDELDIDKQIKLFDKAVSERPGAIVLAPSDYAALKASVEKAYNNHIPVIITDTKVDSKHYKSLVSTDNIEAGQNGGRAIIKLTNGKARLGIINFVKGSKNAMERQKGVMSIIKKYKNIKVCDIKYCLSDSNLAYRQTKAIIKKYKDLNSILALNTIAAKGVIKAVNEMKLENKIKVVAFDNTPNEIDALDNGTVKAIVIQNPFEMGYLSIKYASRAASNKSVPKEVNTGSQIIYRKDLFDTKYQKLLFPSQSIKN
jgi:ribose transport system substrate-binding protein